MYTLYSISQYASREEYSLQYRIYILNILLSLSSKTMLYITWKKYNICRSSRTANKIVQFFTWTNSHLIGATLDIHLSHDFLQFWRKFLMCWKVELFVRDCSAVFKWRSYFYNTPAAKMSLVPFWGIFLLKLRIRSSLSAKSFIWNVF